MMITHRCRCTSVPFFTLAAILAACAAVIDADGRAALVPRKLLAKRLGDPGEIRV